MRWQILISLVWIPVIGASHSFGCSCKFQCAKEAWEETPLVFVGHIQRVETTRHPGKKWSWKDGSSQPYTTQKAWIQVDENFKGAKANDVFVTADTDGDCALQFGDNAGHERWLFYAWPDRGTAVAHLGCTRSARLDLAGDDLLFLRSLPDSAHRNRLSGTVVRVDRMDSEIFDTQHPVGGIGITIQGDGKTYEAKTDTNGAFELVNLPVGTYRVQLRIAESDLIYMWNTIGVRDSYDAGSGGQPRAVSVGPSTGAQVDFVVISKSVAAVKRSRGK